MESAHGVDSDRVPGVLVGIDGSPDSKRALRVGIKAAKHRGVPLQLVAAYIRPLVMDSYYLSMIDQYLRSMQAETQKMLDGYAEYASESGIEVTTRAVEGDPAAVLIEASRSAEVAVVGKRGRNRFSGRVLGSVSRKLTAHAHCPVVVIPAKWESEATDELLAPAQDLPKGDDAASEPLTQVEESAPRGHTRREFSNVAQDHNFDSEIVVGIDIGRDNDELTSLAAEAAQTLQRPLTLVAAEPLHAEGGWYPNTVEHNLELPNIRRPYTEYLTKAAQQVTERHPGISVRWQFFDGSPAGVLSEASRTAELIVIGTRGHGGFAGLLLGSVSQAVLNRAVCPVLVVPAQKS